MARIIWAVFLTLFIFTDTAYARSARPGDIAVPAGFKIEAVKQNLNMPIMTLFDNQNRMIVVQAGGSETKVIRYEKHDFVSTLVDENSFDGKLPLESAAIYNNQIYLKHGGEVSKILSGKKIEPLSKERIASLPKEISDQLFRDPNEKTFVLGSENKWGQVNEGFKIAAAPQKIGLLKFDLTNGQAYDFIYNRLPGKSSEYGSGGFEDIRYVSFDRNGDMYLTDFGQTNSLSQKPMAATGVIWKVSPAKSDNQALFAPSIFYNFLGALFLALAIVPFLNEKRRNRRIIDGIFLGMISGFLALSLISIISFIFELGWAKPSIFFSAMFLGSSTSPIANFVTVKIIFGILAVLALGATLGMIFSLLIRTTKKWKIVFAGSIFGLAGWTILYHFVFPIICAKIFTQNGLPIILNAGLFVVFGLILGVLSAHFSRINLIDLNFRTFSTEFWVLFGQTKNVLLKMIPKNVSSVKTRENKKRV